MTLFTKTDCERCERLKKYFDLQAMGVAIEVLDQSDAGALAHLAWHGLVETARKTLPILVLDDCSCISDYAAIEAHLRTRANHCGMMHYQDSLAKDSCADGRCSL